MTHFQSKPFQALLLTVGFVVLAFGTYLLHAWYFPVGVVFFSALIDTILATAVMTAVVVTIQQFNRFEKTLLVVVWLLGGYAFAISGPAVLDRSLSFYILEKLQQRGGGIRESSIANVFMNEYMPEFRLIDVRLTEQLQSGTIVIENGCVKLTLRGQRLASFSRYVRTHLLAKHRLLAGQYTDALVDPFKNSKTETKGYECN